MSVTARDQTMALHLTTPIPILTDVYMPGGAADTDHVCACLLLLVTGDATFSVQAYAPILPRGLYSDVSRMVVPSYTFPRIPNLSLDH